MDDFSRADFVDERRVGGIYDDIEFDFNLTDMQDNSEASSCIIRRITLFY